MIIIESTYSKKYIFQLFLGHVVCYILFHVVKCPVAMLSLSSFTYFSQKLGMYVLYSVAYCD